MKPKLIIGNKNYSSWSLRPWLLMKEAGIEFDEHLILLDTPTTKKEITAFSEAGRVPILQLGDTTVWDSLAIAETVAERWPEKKLWPEDADERAHARAISAEMHSGFPYLRDCMPMNCRAMGRLIEIPDDRPDHCDLVGMSQALWRSGWLAVWYFLGGGCHVCPGGRASQDVWY
jgi:glutathione S-transferase